MFMLLCISRCVMYECQVCLGIHANVCAYDSSSVCVHVSMCDYSVCLCQYMCHACLSGHVSLCMFIGVCVCLGSCVFVHASAVSVCVIVCLCVYVCVSLCVWVHHSVHVFKWGL